MKNGRPIWTSLRAPLLCRVIHHHTMATRRPTRTFAVGMFSSADHWTTARCGTFGGHFEHSRNEGETAAIALYAGLFEPSVDRFELSNLPTSHRDGPAFLNVLRVLDMPQAVALAFPRQVTLIKTDEKDWAWPAKVAKLYGEKSPLQVRKVP
jgi:hypothetical protein